MSRKEYSFPERLALVKKARRCDRQRFQHLCQNHGLTTEQLSLWVDCFEAGGEMGLRALDEIVDPPDEEVERAINVVDLYLDYKFPRRKFSIKRRKNKIIVSTSPSVKSGSEGSQVPVFQIRYFETKSKKPLWLLYWQRADGKWWPYKTDKQRIYKIDQLMEEVVSDPHSCLWNF